MHVPPTRRSYINEMDEYLALKEIRISIHGNWSVGEEHIHFEDYFGQGQLLPDCRGAPITHQKQI